MAAGFVVDMVAGYVKTHSYSITDMEGREREIRGKAEQTVLNKLSIHKRVSPLPLPYPHPLTHTHTHRINWQQ